MYLIDIYEDKILDLNLPTKGDGSFMALFTYPYFYIKLQLTKVVACYHMNGAEKKMMSIIKKIDSIKIEDAIHMQKLIESSIDNLIDSEERLKDFNSKDFLVKKYKEYLRTLYKIDNALNVHIYKENKNIEEDNKIKELLHLNNIEVISSKILLD